MTPSQRDRILQAHSKVHEVEKRLEVLFPTLKAALDSNLAAPLMYTLNGMIASHLSGSMSKIDIDVFIEFITITLNIPKDSAKALADYKIATYALLLALRDNDPSNFKGSANG